MYYVVLKARFKAWKSLRNQAIVSKKIKNIKKQAWPFLILSRAPIFVSKSGFDLEQLLVQMAMVSYIIVGSVRYLINADKR